MRGYVYAVTLMQFTLRQ